MLTNPFVIIQITYKCQLTQYSIKNVQIKDCTLASEYFQVEFI